MQACISQALHQLQTNENTKDKVLEVQTMYTRAQASEQQITVLLQSEVAQFLCVPDLHTGTCECFSRSQMVARCTPADCQNPGGYDMPIVTGNKVFIRKITTPIPNQNHVPLNQNGTLVQSSNGYTTGATSSNHGAQAMSQVPSEYELPTEETESITVTMNNITGPVTHQEETPLPFDGVAPPPFYYMYTHENDHDPLRSFINELLIANTQPTLNKLPVSFTTLTSRPPTPTFSRSYVFNTEVSGDSGFGSTTSTNH